MKGKLLSLPELERKFKELGNKKTDTILVLGDPLSGWGEEGRLVWTLRMAGFNKSYWVDGGIEKFLDQKSQSSPKQVLGADVARNHSANNQNFDIDIQAVQRIQDNKEPNFSILDVREEREYLGETPYGESRGGHIPGAKWIYYKEFLDRDGFLKSKDQIISTLKQRNVSPTTHLISYCTGGVRSAWTTSVFLSIGLRAENYSGSMWEWSASEAKTYPLVKGRD